MINFNQLEKTVKKSTQLNRKSRINYGEDNIFYKRNMLIEDSDISHIRKLGSWIFVKFKNEKSVRLIHKHKAERMSMKMMRFHVS